MCWSIDRKERSVKPLPFVKVTACAIVLGCASLPPALPPESDPSNPRAAEAPVLTPSAKPSSPASTMPAAGTRNDAGMPLDPAGASDAGVAPPADHKHHHGARDADGGTP
jgi:hypothetical protein